MKVNLPDSLKDFVDEQVNSGRYADPDAFVAELIETEAAIFERLKRGDVLPLDEHFDRRLEVLLDDAEKSGDYVSASKEDFDAMERGGLERVWRARGKGHARLGFTGTH